MRSFPPLMPVVIVLGLAGCSIHPLPDDVADDVTRKGTYGIVQKIRCEVRRALEDHPGDFYGGAIAYEFEFNITEVNNASAGATLVLPFAKGGLFSLGANAGADRTRGAVRNFKIADSFSEARKTEGCSGDELKKNWIYPIAGDIGMYEVVTTFLNLRKVEGPEGKEVFTFADHLTFTTALSGGLQPTLTLTPVVGRLRVTSANANLQASRTDIHKVTVALAGGVPTITGQPKDGRRSKDLVFHRFIASSTSSTVGLTLLQAEASAKGKALLELDRQRLLELQRTKDIIVLP